MILPLRFLTSHLKPQNTKNNLQAAIAPEDAMQEIDAYAEEHGFTRSGFLIQAAMEKVRSPKRAA